jgi:hypothetical protein
MAKTIYLERANRDLVCHCRCRQSLISAPSQMDCPWCGCGWLFTCMNCRKAYAFARGVEVDQALEDLAREDLAARDGGAAAEREDVDRWVEWMGVLLRGVEPGRQYVYFDGYYVDVETGPVGFDGWHSRHDLPWVPQVQAMADPTVLHDTIGSEEYWRETAIEERR